LTQGFFAPNKTFRPNDNISKWEALKMVMVARGIQKGSDSDFRKGYVDGDLAAGLIDSSFTDYDMPAVRGWIFTA
jgi:hypothetical protein